jgi:hypothetical protein
LNRSREQLHGALKLVRAGGGTRLIDLEDTRCLHHRGLLLALGKALGAFTVDIDPGKLLAVVIIHGYLPVAVLATPILVQPSRPLCPFLFHDGLTLESLNTRKFRLDRASVKL